MLKLKIKALFEANNEEYGYRRLHAALVRGGEQVGQELVRQLMRELELHSLPAEAVAGVADRAGRSRPIPNPVNRDFSAQKPGEKMVGDITYIPLPGRADPRRRRDRGVDPERGRGATGHNDPPSRAPTIRGHRETAPLLS